MKYRAIPLLVTIVLCVFLAGCTQSPVTAPVTPAPAMTTVSTPVPETTVPAPGTTAVPQQVVTVIHQVSQVRDIRDSELLFTLQVPVEWDVSTYRESSDNDPEMVLYRTDLLGDDVFYINTYMVSRSQDQAFRDQFRKWSPVVSESTVTINSIVYDRFESSSGGRTRVAYVARKSSANERGYASVLVFSADDNNRFQKDDFERVVSSFRYMSAESAGSAPGDEIPRVNPPFESSAGMVSAKGSGDSGSSGSSSSGGCSRCGR